MATRPATTKHTAAADDPAALAKADQAAAAAAAGPIAEAQADAIRMAASGTERRKTIVVAAAAVGGLAFLGTALCTFYRVVDAAVNGSPKKSERAFRILGQLRDLIGLPGAGRPHRGAGPEAQRPVTGTADHRAAGASDEDGAVRARRGRRHPRRVELVPFDEGRGRTRTRTPCSSGGASAVSAVVR